MGPVDALTGEQVSQAGLKGWVNLRHCLFTRLRTADLRAGLAVLTAIVEQVTESDPPPQFDLRSTFVDVRVGEPSPRPVTQDQVDLAARISAIAVGAGAQVDGSRRTFLELGLDTPDGADILPFWRAALGLEIRTSSELDDEVVDLSGDLPSIWFQESGREEPRQRWHLDVWIDPSQVQGRIDGAVAAGGTLVSDADAPAFWVLADSDGNRICLCTWVGR